MRVMLKARRNHPDTHINHQGLIITVGMKDDNVKQTLLREARQHLECAQALHPEGVVARAFIHKVRLLL